MKNLAIGLLLCLGACTTTYTVTLPNVSATQQLIGSVAEDKAVNSLSISIPKKLTFVDSSHYTGSQYMLAAFYSKLLDSGVSLTINPHLAGQELIVFDSVDSINHKTYFAGTPSIPVTPIFSIPSMSIYSENRNISIARIYYTVFDLQTGEKVASGTSKYGVEEYGIYTMPFLGTFDYPRINSSDIVK